MKQDFGDLIQTDGEGNILFKIAQLNSWVTQDPDLNSNIKIMW